MNTLETPVGALSIDIEAHTIREQLQVFARRLGEVALQMKRTDPRIVTAVCLRANEVKYAKRRLGELGQPVAFDELLFKKQMKVWQRAAQELCERIRVERKRGRPRNERRLLAERAARLMREADIGLDSRDGIRTLNRTLELLFSVLSPEADDPSDVKRYALHGRRESKRPLSGVDAFIWDITFGGLKKQPLSP